MKVKNKILILLIIILILFTSGMSIAVNKIDYTQTEGSLTIIKKVKEKPLAGVTFRIYKVNDNAEDTSDNVISEYTALDAWDYNNAENNSLINKDGTLYATEKVTGTNGEAKFEKLPLGRYLVKETQVPANIREKIEPFLIDIPYINENDKNLDYNPKVTPKNVIDYAKVTLTKKGNEGVLLKGVKFDLEKNVSGNIWKKVNGKDSLETNNNGQIVIEGLDLGKYRLIETSLGEDSSTQGYILDNSKVYDFTVTSVNGVPSVDKETIEVINEKPTIEEVVEDIVLNSNSEYAKRHIKNESANIGDIVKYKVTLSVPEVISKLQTFKVTGALNTNLALSPESFQIVGTKRGGRRHNRKFTDKY